MQNLTPNELRARLAEPSLQILDVRRDDEWMGGHLEGAQHICLDELPQRLGELDPKLPVVCYCKAGVRSLHAAQILEAAGFADVYSLLGGIMAWQKLP
jgi:hydroxyacylglutathione hydrolase